MKVKSLEMKNFAGFSEISVSFDENVTWLIGKNGSGKSSIGVNGILAALQGIAEKGKNVLIGERFRFIGQKAATAELQLIIHDEIKNVDIQVNRKITKTGNVLSFEAPEGYPVSQEWLNDLFNIFLIAPKKFLALNSKEQAEALGIDTAEYDVKMKRLKEEYTLINRDITQIGSFDAVEETEEVDVSKLNEERDAILLFNKGENDKQQAIQIANDGIDTLVSNKEDLQAQIDQLTERMKAIDTRIENGKKHIKSLAKPKKLKELTEIDEKIRNASETNKKAFEYTQYTEKLEKLKNKRAELQTNKDAQETLLSERKNYIKNQELPFDNLEINEDGELLLAGKPIKEPYFSTGELIRTVPILMASKNPDLKYVFIQDFNLLDEDKQKDVIEHLTSKGLQLVIELIGTKKVSGENSILLKDCEVVETYEEKKHKNLL